MPEHAHDHAGHQTDPLAPTAVELSTLLAIARNLAATLELEPLLRLILDEVRSAVDYHGAGILILEGDSLVQVAQRGPALEGLSHDLRILIADNSAMEQALALREPVLIPDVWADTPEALAYRRGPGEEWLRARPYVRTWLGVPLEVHGRTLGIMVITYGEPNAFTEHHIRILTAVAAHAAVAIENARLVESARRAAVLEERQRLARDLHDAVTQTLFSASLIGDVLPALWQRDPHRGEEALEDLRVLTRGALAEMRTLLYELRPNAITEAPLGELLRYLADATAGRTRLPISVTIHHGAALPPDVQIAFYRIAQEALNNVIKHANARHVELSLVDTAVGATELCIHDDGCGFDPARARPGHFGVRTMLERAAAIGANLSMGSSGGRGTVVRLHWRGDRSGEESDTDSKEP